MQIRAKNIVLTSLLVLGTAGGCAVGTAPGQSSEGDAESSTGSDGPDGPTRSDGGVLDAEGDVPSSDLPDTTPPATDAVADASTEVAGGDATPRTLSVSFIDLDDGDDVSGRVQIGIEAASPRGIEAVSVAVDGTEQTTLDSSPFEWTWDTTSLDPGRYTLSATATDGSGATASTSIDVDVRRKCKGSKDCGPTVDLLYPGEGSEVCGVLTVSAEASDDNGVDRVDFALDGSSIGTSQNAPHEIEWDTNTATDSTHTLQATAYDTAGQSFFTAIDVTVDNSGSGCNRPPLVTITEPTDGSYLNGIVTIEANATDDKGLDRVTFSLDGSRIERLSQSPYEFQFDTSNVAEGTHTLEAVATDTGGKTDRSTVQLSVDRTPPSVQIAEPAKGKVFRDPGQIRVEARPSDNVAVQKVEMSLGNATKTATASPWVVTFDVSGRSGGTVDVAAEVTDEVGQTARASRSIRIDRPPSVRFQQPQAGATLTSATTVSVEATDDGVIDRVEFRVGSQKIGTFQYRPGSSSTYVYDWTPGPSLQGRQTLKAVAVDRQMQQSTASIQVDVRCEQVFYRDADGDGYGDPGNTKVLRTCKTVQAPSGYVDDDSDCDDGSAKTYPGAAENESSSACMKDADDDGYGDDNPPSGVTPGNDCDDGSAKTHPGAASRDSTSRCMKDADDDGYGDDNPPSGVASGTDCNDGDKSVNPDASESCGNGRDDDCDGQTDERCPTTCDELFNCLDNCPSSNSSCSGTCQNRATSQAESDALAYQRCASNNNCSGTTLDTDCVRNNCKSEARACDVPLPGTASGDKLSCSAHNTCQQLCDPNASGDTCIDSIIRSTSQSSFDAYQSLITCFEQNCANATNQTRCLENNCPSQRSACFEAPVSGSPSTCGELERCRANTGLIDCAERNNCIVGGSLDQTCARNNCPNKTQDYIDCRLNAPQRAIDNLNALNNCMNNNCSNASNVARCRRNNCALETRRCYKCP